MGALGGHHAARTVVRSFQNFWAEEMLAHSFSEWASKMFGPKEIMSRPG
jgi:hypothetical protein